MTSEKRQWLGNLKLGISWGVLAAALGVLTCTEAGYFLGDGSTIKHAVALAWIVISAGFLATVALRSMGILLEGEFWRDRDRVWYCIALALPFGLVYFDVAGITWTPINDEGAQQVTQGLDLLRHDADFGVYKTAYFVGYIARQYLLTSLPSYFFGPSLVALRIGNSFIYLVGYVAFLSALAHFFRARGARNPLILASFAGVLVSLGEYPIIIARTFEQTTMPMGAMLLFLAGVLHFLNEPTPFRIFWVAWAFGFFAEGYTPGLGGWCLALVILLYLSLHPDFKHRILLLPTAYGICCMVVACMVLGGGRLHDRLQMGASGLVPSDWAWRYFMGYHTFMGGGTSVIPYPLALASITVLYFSFRFRDLKFPLMCLWCIGIAMTGITFVGSNFNLPQFDIHRSIMVLPALAAGVVLFYHAFSSRLEPAHGAHRAMTFLAGLSMAYMIWTSLAVPLANRTYVYQRDMTDYDEALYKIDCVNYDSGPGTVKKVYLVAPLRIDDLETGLGYFAPGAVVVRSAPPPGEKEAGAYTLSYLAPNTSDPIKNPIIPSKSPRPYLVLKPE